MLFSLPMWLSIASGVFFSLLGLSYKIAEARGCRSTPFAVVFTLVAFDVSLLGALNEKTAWGDWRLWALGLLMGASLFAGISLIVRANQLGPAAVNWTMVNLAILLPILLSPLLFHEHLLFADGLLILFFVLMLLAFARGMAADGEMKTAHRGVYLLYVSLVFLNNGLFMLGHKYKFAFFGDTSSAGMMTLCYGGCLLLALATHLVRDRSALRPAEWAAGAMAGLCSSLGLLCFLHSLSLPTVVTYPISQGIALLGGVLLTVTCYREPLNTLKAVGFALGLLVLLAATTRQQLSAMLAAAWR